MKKILTLCLIHQPPRILLGMKKRGFGAGRWNGFGGKISGSETIEEAACREVKEEAGIEVGDLHKVGILDFEFQGNPQILQVHLFHASDFTGEPTESEEMKPVWFPVDQIPFPTMWSSDHHWMPLFLAGKKFTGRFLFDGADQVVEYQLKEAEVL